MKEKKSNKKLELDKECVVWVRKSKKAIYTFRHNVNTCNYL